MDVTQAVARIKQFRGESVRMTVAHLENALSHSDAAAVGHLNITEGIAPDLLAALGLVKTASAQIDTLVHAAGILAALPYLLDPGEVVQSVSLGADNAHRGFDLETDRQVAEFKFTRWQPAGNALREKTLFADFFKLASATTPKKRYLYLLETDRPIRFLSGRRLVTKVLNRNVDRLADFLHLYGELYPTVGDYYRTFLDLVKLVNLQELAPAVLPLVATLED